jgi:hypothetical protein
VFFGCSCFPEPEEALRFTYIPETNEVFLRSIFTFPEIVPGLGMQHAGAASEIDKEVVKTVALQIGVREAARQFGLSEERVMKWSQRGNWFAQKELSVSMGNEKRERSGLSALVRKTPSEILLSLGSKSKLRAAKVGDNTLKAMQKRKGEALIAGSGAFLNTVNALSKVHDWGTTTQGTPTTAFQVNTQVVVVHE